MFTYFMDANAYDAEGQGFWVKGAASSDIVLRTEHPLTRIEFLITSRVANTVTVTFGGRSQQVVIGEDGVAKVRMAPGSPLDVHLSYPYLLHVETTHGFFPRDREPTSQDVRYLGAFVQIAFMYGPQGEPQAPPPGTTGGG